jgi:hypothetical protein
MAGVPVPSYQQLWANKCLSLQAEQQNLVGKYPDAASPVRQLFKVLCNIEDLAGWMRASIVENMEWAAIVSSAEENQSSYC